MPRLKQKVEQKKDLKQLQVAKLSCSLVVKGTIYLNDLKNEKIG